MRSVQLQDALAAFLDQAAARLHADVQAGQEVPFELETRTARMRGAALYCYRPLTDAFIAERFAELRRLDGYPAAVAQLERCETLERYLLARGVEAPRRGERDADAVLLALLQDVFAEQTDFEASWLAQHPERLERALQRLDGSALPSAGEVTVVAMLHGLAISSPELVLARGLTLARPEALRGVPEQALLAGRSQTSSISDRWGPRRSPLGGSAERGHLLVVYTAADATSGPEGVAAGVDVVRELLRALRLFGDGRIALGARAWARVGDGRWSTIALGAGGHPHGVLLVTAEQEDELRPFCSLVARRAPADTPVAWALRRFELGCDRADEYEALSDHLLALRALLAAPAAGSASEAPRATESAVALAPSDGQLAARLAALCALPERRRELGERALAAIALERECIAGTAVRHAAGLALARELADHLRALLRDVVCGHLQPELAELADEILVAEKSAPGPDGAEAARSSRRRPARAGEVEDRAAGAAGGAEQLALPEQQLADQGDPSEVLRVAV